MSDQDFDFGGTLKAKSDQLNAADLVGTEITAQITGGKMTGNEQQPVAWTLSGGHMPWLPCKTMRRLLAELIGSTKASAIIGRWVTLYNDPSVTYGRDRTGGVRLTAMSGLDRARKVTLMTRRGQYTTYEVRPLREPRQQGAPTADLDALLADNDLTRDDVDRWLVANDKPTLDTDPSKVPGLAVWLAGDVSRLDAIRALVPAEPGDES